MKQLLLISLIWLCSSVTIFAQNSKLFFHDTLIKNKQFELSIKDVMAFNREIKFRLTLKNLSKDWLVYNAEYSSVRINEKFQTPFKTVLVLAPGEEKSKIIRVNGINSLDFKEFNFDLKNLSSASIKPIPIIETFKLPVGVSELSEPPVNLTLLKVSKTSSKTDIKFSILNSGENILVCFPSKLGVKMPDGNHYPNEYKHETYFIVEKGEQDEFSGYWLKMSDDSANDMQTADMYIEFNDMFQELTVKQAIELSITLRLDDQKTKANN